MWQKILSETHNSIGICTLEIKSLKYELNIVG